jgi:hypothetical protein
MVYYVLKTRANETSVRIFYILKRDDVPVEDRDKILQLNCSSVRKFSGISIFLQYLEQNSSNALHETEPYILKRIN